MAIDYEHIEAACPKCGHEPIHRRDCDNIHCQDGQVDENDDDAINFAPGESVISCSECKGTGYEIWCPECRADLTTEIIDFNEDYI